MNQIKILFFGGTFSEKRIILLENNDDSFFSNP